MDFLGWILFGLTAFAWMASAGKQSGRRTDFGSIVSLKNLSERYTKMNISPHYRGIELVGLDVTLSDEDEKRVPVLVPLDDRAFIIFVDESEIERPS